MRTRIETLELTVLVEKELHNAANYANKTVKFHGRKSDEFAQVSLVRIHGCDIDK